MWKLQFIFWQMVCFTFTFQIHFFDKVLLISVKPKPSCIINEISDYNPVTALREREEHRLPLTDACLWHGKQCLLSGHTKPSMNWKTHALQRERKQYRSIIGYNVHRPDGESRRMRVQVSTPIHCKTLQEQFTQKWKFIIHPPISNPYNFPLLYGLLW